ncbi:MAG TPA: SDR family oxidoreductase [Candidatus Kapabacteria bacterium]|nr:SDR family oxidoreductase [Candidatus Kapabacteria bacterium]
MNNYGLNGKIAIVTGARRGIGRGIALLLAKNGAKVVVTDIDQADCQKVVDEIKQLSGDGLALKVDVTLEDDIKNMVKATLDKFGRIDILVNNAGIFIQEPLDTMDTSKIDKILDINLRGTIIANKYVIPTMKSQNYGKIVNLCSIAGFVAFPNSSVYCATKGAILNLTRELAVELAPNHINVNAVAPGVIETPMTADLLATEEGKKALLGAIPYGRVGKPDDIANAVGFLASDDSEYITGHTIVVDGGWIAQ